MIDPIETEVLYRNSQWMVQRYNGSIFLAEVVEVNYSDLDPSDDGYEELFLDRKRMELGGGWWANAKDFAVITNSHDMIAHVCGKNWVDIDALELAVLHLLLISGIRPNYDVGKQFAEARKRKLRWSSKSEGPMHVSEIALELLSEAETA